MTLHDLYAHFLYTCLCISFVTLRIIILRARSYRRDTKTIICVFDQIEYQDGTCKRRLLQSTATLWNSQNYAESQKKSIPRTIIAWVIALCIWLKRKLLQLSDVSFLMDSK